MAYSRPQSKSSSAALFPLDAVLGSVANIRLLRVLSQHGGLIGAPELALNAGLSRPGTWKSLAELQGYGIVEAIGTGRSNLYRLSEDHPLSDGLRSLFARERDRVVKFLDSVRRSAGKLGKDVLAVWLFGSVARGDDVAASDLDLAVLVRTARNRRLAEQVAASLKRAAATHRFKVSVISLTVAELEELAATRADFWQNLTADAIVVRGAHPAEFV